MFGDQDISKLTLQEFLAGIGKFERKIDADPSKRCFSGLKRTNGRFDEESLVRILQAAIEEPAGM